MKAILELTKAITDDNYHSQQFDVWGSDKNILFINPQLSGKHLYKMLLPSRIMRSEGISTAITTISKYDPHGQLLGGKEVELNDTMINWAEYFVFPFTTQPLGDLYERIREINSDAKIVYSIDFNFYELSDKHPYKYIFDELSVISDVEDNIFFSDIALVSNAKFQELLTYKFKELITKGKYKGVPTKLVVGCFPFMIDSEIMYENVEFDIQDFCTVTHTPFVKEELEKTSKVFEELKTKDIKGKDKDIPLKNTSPKPIKKSVIKTVKANGSTKKRTAAKSTTTKSTTAKSKSSKSSSKPSSSRTTKK